MKDMFNKPKNRIIAFQYRTGRIRLGMRRERAINCQNFLHDDLWASAHKHRESDDSSEFGDLFTLFPENRKERNSLRRPLPPPPPSSENTEIFCNSFLLEKYHQNNKSQQKSICKSTGLIQVRMAKNSIDHI